MSNIILLIAAVVAAVIIPFITIWFGKWTDSPSKPTFFWVTVPFEQTFPRLVHRFCWIVTVVAMGIWFANLFDHRSLPVWSYVFVTIVGMFSQVLLVLVMCLYLEEIYLFFQKGTYKKVFRKVLEWFIGTIEQSA